MVAILRDPHLDTRIKICILINVIVPKLEYEGEVWEGNAYFVKQLETVRMTAAKKILGCSSTTSITVLRAELGMYPLETNGDVRKLKWRYKVKDMPEKRLPAIVDDAVWEKITRGRAGIRWDNAVEKIWKDVGGDQEEELSTETFGGRVQDRTEITKRRKGKANANKYGERGDHLEIYEGLREDIGMETYLHGGKDYAKKLTLRFRVGNLELPERWIYTSGLEEEDVATTMCPCGTTIESRTHIVVECEICKEERDALKEEIMKLDVCDMEEFGRLESSEKTIAILGDRWWPQTAKQEGERISKQFLCSIWKERNERPNVGGVSIRSRNGAPSRKGCVVNGQLTQGKQQMSTPSPPPSPVGTTFTSTSRRTPPPLR